VYKRQGLTIDTATLRLRSRLLPGSAPSGLALTGAGTLLVSQSGDTASGKLDAVDPRTGTPVTIVRAGAGVDGIVRVEGAG